MHGFASAVVFTSRKTQFTQTPTNITSSIKMIGYISNVCKISEQTDPLIVFTFWCEGLNIWWSRYFSFLVQVECYDYDNDGSHDLIGTFETTMSRFKEASRSSPV